MATVYRNSQIQHDYYNFFFENPEYYYYGISIAISILILFMGDWDVEGEKKILNILLHRFKRIVLGICMLFVLIVPPSLYILAGHYYGKDHQNYWMLVFTDGLKDSIFIMILLPCFCIWLKVVFHRFIYPWISGFKHKTRVRQSSANLSDIRAISTKDLMVEIDPRTKYKNGFIHLGLDADDNPVRLEYEDWKTKHMRIIAASTSGKGVLIGVMLDQAIRLGSLPIFVDGKPDRYALPIIRKACEETGRKLVEINMQGKSEYCYEPFLSGTDNEIKERLWTILDLHDSGTDADFYKKGLRLEISVFLENEWDGLIASLIKFLDGVQHLDTTSPREILHEFSNLGSILCRDNLIDLDSLIASDDVVIYVRTSLTNKAIKTMANCFIQNVVQSAKRQDLKNIVHRPLFIDEVRFYVSELMADSLATMADFGVNFVLTYQSYSDLMNIKDIRLNAKSISQSINTNCLITYVGLAADRETADVFEGETGTIVKEVYDRIKINTNAVGGDQYDGQAFMANKDVPLFSVNDFLTFPRMVGVLINKPKIATVLRSSFIPIDIKKEYAYINPVFKGREGTEVINPKTIEKKSKSIKDNDVFVLSLDSENQNIADQDDDYSVLFKK